MPLEELEVLAREYFDKLTPEKFERDCAKAKVRLYNTIEESILGGYSERVFCSFPSHVMHIKNTTETATARGKH